MLGKQILLLITILIRYKLAGFCSVAHLLLTLIIILGITHHAPQFILSS